jgi:hypothetical protein
MKNTGFWKLHLRDVGLMAKEVYNFNLLLGHNLELRGCGKKLLYVLGQLGHGIDICRVDINEIWTHWVIPAPDDI